MTATQARPVPTAAPAPARPAPWWRTAGPAMAVGLVSALWGLGRMQLWLDEAYSLGAVHQLPRSLRETSGTMATYYLLLSAWTSVSESVVWMRSLSVALAVGSLLLTARLAERLVGERRARLVTVLTALSFLWLVYAREARSYGLVLVLSGASWLVFERAVAGDGPGPPRRWWALHTVLAVLLPLTHGLSTLQVLAQVALLAVVGADRATWLRLLRGVGGALGVTAVLLSGGANQVGDWVAPLSATQVGVAVNMLTSPFPIGALAMLVLAGAGVRRSIGIARSTPDRLARFHALLPIAWAVVPLLLLVALSVARPSLVPRYVLGSIPGIALLLIAGVDALAERRPSWRTPVVVGLVVLMAAGHLHTHRAADDAWSGATETVAEGAREGDEVLFGAVATRPVFEAAWRAVEDAPALPVVGSPRPLGRVLRFDDGTAEDRDRWLAARDLDRVWLVADVGRGEAPLLDLLLEDAPGRPASHVIAERWEAAPGGITVLLLERRQLDS
ncbi:MAG TPA: hypothetical protein VK507_23675 [Iamia sp.]|nr:hypothetical protein [Iamia sp.]